MTQPIPVANSIRFYENDKHLKAIIQATKEEDQLDALIALKTKNNQLVIFACFTNKKKMVREPTLLARLQEISSFDSVETGSFIVLNNRFQTLFDGQDAKILYIQINDPKMLFTLFPNSTLKTILMRFLERCLVDFYELNLNPIEFEKKIIEQISVFTNEAEAQTQTIIPEESTTQIQTQTQNQNQNQYDDYMSVRLLIHNEQPFSVRLLFEKLITTPSRGLPLEQAQLLYDDFQFMLASVDNGTKRALSTGLFSKRKKSCYDRIQYLKDKESNS